MAASSATSAQLASVIAAASGKASLDQLMENLQRHQKMLHAQQQPATSQPTTSQAQTASSSSIIHQHQLAAGIIPNSNGASSPSHASGENQTSNTSKESIELAQNKAKQAAAAKNAERASAGSGLSMIGGIDLAALQKQLSGSSDPQAAASALIDHV